MLRMKFEKFLNYLQGSLNFSEFMRKEISKFGVGQAAVDMSFQTSVQFPEVFLLDKIVGEIPLDVYTITLADVLSQAELEDPNVQKEYYLERIDLNSRFIQANINSVAIENVFKELDTRGRTLDVRGLMQVMINEKVGKDTIVQLLRGFGLSDATVTKAFGYIT